MCKIDTIIFIYVLLYYFKYLYINHNNMYIINIIDKIYLNYIIICL